MSLKHEILIELLREVNRGIGEYVKAVLSQHNIPLTTITITREIGREPGITVSELARRTGIAKSHISNIIRELHQRDWVEKRADTADQRILRLYLSERAAEHLALARIEIRQQINALVSDIPEDRAADLIAGLEDIKAALDRAKNSAHN